MNCPWAFFRILSSVSCLLSPFSLIACQRGGRRQAGESPGAERGPRQAFRPGGYGDAGVVLGLVEFEGDGHVPSRELSDVADAEVEGVAAVEIELLAECKHVLLVDLVIHPEAQEVRVDLVDEAIADEIAESGRAFDGQGDVPELPR